MRKGERKGAGGRGKGGKEPAIPMKKIVPAPCP